MSDVYLSIDSNVYCYVGRAIDPITPRLPFTIPCDRGLIGATVHVKIVAGDSADLGSIDGHPYVVGNDSAVKITDDHDH